MTALWRRAWWLRERPETVSAFAQRFIPSLLKQIRKRGWSLTPRQQFFLLKEYRRVQNLARRARVEFPASEEIRAIRAADVRSRAGTGGKPNTVHPEPPAPARGPGETTATEAAAETGAKASPDAPPVSARQQRMERAFALLMEGKTVPQIAQVMGFRESTIWRYFADWIAWRLPGWKSIPRRLITREQMEAIFLKPAPAERNEKAMRRLMGEYGTGPVRIVLAVCRALREEQEERSGVRYMGAGAGERAQG